MNTIRPIYSERVSYEMYNETLGTIVLEVDPIGWKADNKEYARNEEYDGITAKFSNNLTFLGDGAEFINTVFDLYDVIGQVKLTKKELHPNTDIPYRTYWGYLDLNTREIEGSHVKVKFNAGGLEQDLKARENESVEIDRISTIDGKPINQLTTDLVALDGRRIFLKSEWKENSINNYTTVTVTSDAGNTRDATTGFPLNVVSQSHEEAQSVLGMSMGTEDVGTTGIMIMSPVDRDKQIVISTSGITFIPTLIDADYDWVDIRVCLTVYRNGTAYDLKERFIKWSNYGERFNDAGIMNMNNQTQSVADFTQVLDLQQGDSVAIEFHLRSDIISGSNRRVTFNFTNCIGNVIITEDSHFEPTQAEMILVHELSDRMANIITNKKDVFKSDYFGRTNIGYLQDGPGAYNGVTHGFWIRGFNKLPISDDNKFKPMTLSWKDLIDSLEAIHNVSLGIETINNREIIRIEDKKYFYQPVVTIKLAEQVKNVKRKVATKKYFGSVEIGYERGGSYEEAQGLDEYNAKSKFTTIMKIKEVYTKLSKFRADSYGMEFARRKPFIRYSSTDTSYDSDLFILDLKKGPAAVFQQRKWQDDFAQAPTGTFSPDTATNLRFSPLNMLLRHGWWIGACLLKYPSEFLRYASSTANSALTTKLIGGNTYAENGNVLNSELKKPYFVPEEITFEHECDFFTMQKIEGYTTMPNGKRIPNFYGMIEFTNEKGEIERGWFLNIKPNSGEFTIIKSNL